VISLAKLKRYISIAFIALIISTFNFSNFNLIIGSLSYANSTNFDKLYWGSVVILRNVHSNKILNIAEGPVGPNVVWSPETAKQNNDNTNVVLRKEGTNIIMLMNRHTRKILGVNKSGLSESKLEVQTPTYNFNPYQSFYVDYLSNGNIYFTSVAFPTKIITLPYGGTRNNFVNYILYDKDYVADSLQSQFKVDYQGDGANTFYQYSNGHADGTSNNSSTPVEPNVEPVKESPNATIVQPIVPTTINQYDKLRTGAVIVLRNADLNQPLRIIDSENGNPIYSAPVNTAVNDEMKLVAVNKPGTNIYQFFNQKNGKVLSVSTTGQVGDWVEVWKRVPNFNPYQSFYIDLLANGNIVLCPVAFPHLVLNLPEGGRSKAFEHFTLWSKENLIYGLNRQFKIDVLGYGANTNMSNSFVQVPNKTTASKTLLKPSSTPITIQGGNDGSLTFWSGMCFVFCPTIVDGVAGKILYGDDVIEVSLEKDGKSWEAANDDCQRKGGFLQWYINEKKDYAEKTCFKTRL
jgi:hypothetical protein